MKSRLTIDFRGIDVMPSGQQFEPVIRATVEDSEDTRDGLMKAFFQGLGGQSNWLSVDINTSTSYGKENQHYTITPVTSYELLETAEIIINRLPHDERIKWLKNMILVNENYKTLDAIIDNNK